MVAIEHRVKSTPATTTAATTAIDTTSSDNNNISDNTNSSSNNNNSGNNNNNNNLNNNNNNNNNNNSNLATTEVILSPVTPTSPTSTSTTTSSTTTNCEKQDKHELKSTCLLNMSGKVAASSDVKETKTDEKPKKNSATSQRSVDIKIAAKSQELTKRGLKLDLKKSQDLDDYSLKSPKSPISVRLPHQTSLTSSVDVEDRKTLREALYQGIFSRHRRTIFAFGSFLRMLRSRTSQYNTIRSSSEGEDVDEVR